MIVFTAVTSKDVAACSVVVLVDVHGVCSAVRINR